MIATELYNGQGLGNQLWCYVVTRTIALRHGYEFGIEHPERFKGSDFLTLDFGAKISDSKEPEGSTATILPDGITNYYRERELWHPQTGADIRTYDWNLIWVRDGTKVDGIMQGEEYITEYKHDIRSWLAVDPAHDCRTFSSENICIINFRGGEYTRHKELLLPKKYWSDAIQKMKALNADMKFVVITDDIVNAKKFFPDFAVHHFSIAKDYAIIHRTTHLILSNSSFAWFAAWLSEDLKYCIAPKYWARHAVSDGYWSMSTNITSGWQYLDRNGVLYDATTCRAELARYQKEHPDYYSGESVLHFQVSFRQKIRRYIPGKLVTFIKRFLV